jgi:hypothetical protein
MVSVTYDSITHWATIVNYPGSPSFFEVSFFKESGRTDIPKIILEMKDNKLELPKDSPVINEGLAIAVIKAFESHAVEKNLSL